MESKEYNLIIWSEIEKQMKDLKAVCHITIANLELKVFKGISFSNKSWKFSYNQMTKGVKLNYNDTNPQNCLKHLKIFDINLWFEKIKKWFHLNIPDLRSAKIIIWEKN